MRCIVGVAAIAAWAVGAPVAVGLSCPVMSGPGGAQSAPTEPVSLKPALLQIRSALDEALPFGLDGMHSEISDMSWTLARLQVLRAADVVGKVVKPAAILPHVGSW